MIAIPKDCSVEFYEVKVPGKKPSVLQQFRLKELNDHGCNAKVYDGQ